jgi:uncharacterized membrane protein
MIEANLRIALRSGKMSPEARPYMGSAVFVTRIGMALTLLTGIGFIVIYLMTGATYKLESGMFWAKMAMVVIIYVNAFLLHKRLIGLYWGSALSFVSWWGALLAGLFMSNNIRVYPQDQVISFIIVMALYGAAIAGGAWVLHRVREMGKEMGKVPGGVPASSSAPSATSASPSAQKMPIVQTADEALGRVKPAETKE